jgi:2-methylcitrate dehydratase PrpD
MTLSGELSTFAAGLRFADLPRRVVDDLKLRVLDCLGVSLAARGLAAPLAVGRVLAGKPTGGSSTALDGSGRMSPADAALVNGTLAHSLDFDDTHLPSIVHPSAPLVPAVLATAEATGASGREMLAALSTGYEVCLRLARAQYDERLKNSTMFERGLHATSLIGAPAGAVACAKLRGLPAEGIADALAIACSLGSGLIEANRTGGTVKPLHCGWAAHGAVIAAELAAAGMTGPPTALEGRFGFFRAFAGRRWERAAVSAELGHRWDSPSVFFKPYPCNHFTHAVADAAISLRVAGLTPEEVRSVSIGTARASLRTIGRPITFKRRPSSPQHARFSAPYVFAAALAGGGGLGLDREDFTVEAIADPRRRALSERCSVVRDESCDTVFPYQFPAVVRVRTRSGTQLVAHVMTTRGGPQRPLTAAELTHKLNDNVDDAGPLSRAVAGLDRAPDVREVLRIAAHTTPPASDQTGGRDAG